MADGWLEPRTRIPFIGIIAIVVIVAVVAVFIKTQLAPLFPAASVTVDDEQSLTGRATSDSFYGLREVRLTQELRLTGLLDRQDGTYRYTVDTDNLLLTIDDGKAKEQVVLVRDGAKLKASFEYKGIPTIVVIDPQLRMLDIANRRSMPVNVPLTELPVYTGMFLFKQNHDVLFIPSQAVVRIDGTPISLTQADGTFSGTWSTDKERPITIDMRERLLKIEEVY